MLTLLVVFRALAGSTCPDSTFPTGDSKVPCCPIAQIVVEGKCAPDPHMEALFKELGSAPAGGIGGSIPSSSGQSSPPASATAPPPSVQPTADPVVLGSLPKADIDAVLKRNMSQIRYCYASRLKSQPTLSGRMVVRFTIGTDGAVKSAETTESTLKDEVVESCVVGRVKTFKFPAPTGGEVVVSYPFEFSPG